jgi:hypothetical protein
MVFLGPCKPIQDKYLKTGTGNLAGFEVFCVCAEYDSFLLGCEFMFNVNSCHRLRTPYFIHLQQLKFIFSVDSEEEGTTFPETSVNFH